MTGVGTRKVFENDKVSIWEFFLEPGESLERHTHSLDYIFYVIEGSAVEISNAEGSKVMNLSSGETFEFRIEAGQQIRVGTEVAPAPATHSARNVGTTTRYRQLLVEMKA